MRSMMVFSLVCIVPAMAAGDGKHPSATKPAGTKMVSGKYPEKAAIWKKYEVRGVQIGMTVEQLIGFTCRSDKKAGEFAYRCVRFIDEKCKGLPTFAHDTDACCGGHHAEPQGCTYDADKGGTYLNGKWMNAPLQVVAATLTDTDAPRVYQIDSTMAYENVTRDSKILTSMIAKYGEPESFRENTSATRWSSPDAKGVYLDLGCQPETSGSPKCWISVSDEDLFTAERAIQQTVKEANAHAGAEAPKL